jgi:hypothetical protein
MISPDMVNMAFEIAGAIFNTMNVLELLKDRRTKGTFWPAWIAYGAWGVWDLIYVYPALGMWCAESAAFVRVGAGLVWLGYAAYFNRRQEATA